MQCCVSPSSLSRPGPSSAHSLTCFPFPTSVHQFDMYTHTHTVHHLPSRPLYSVLQVFPLKGHTLRFLPSFYKRAEALQRSPGVGSCFRRLRGIYWFSLCLPWASLLCLRAIIGPGTSGKHRGDLSFEERLFRGARRMIKAAVNGLSRRNNMKTGHVQVTSRSWERHSAQ